MMSLMKRILGCVVLGLVTMVASAQWTNPSDDVPAYKATNSPANTSRILLR